MIYSEIVEELNNLGTEQNKKIFKRHGADLEISGVSISNLKLLAKKIPKNDSISKELFLSNNTDAVYLSIYLINPNILTVSEIESVIQKTTYYVILENVIPLLAAKRNDNFDLLHKWLNLTDQKYLQVAYSMYSYMLGSLDNNNFKREHIRFHINYIKDNINKSANRTKYAMNNFLIQVGINYEPLYSEAYDISKLIGRVKVDMGETSCKVPLAQEYIDKTIKMGKQGIKRKL
ncbi:hypothetical protein CI105_03765 [Candidatus Izimaplasma bacterium ZiA1]|uniref:DNA alkylation repair protein n=1 Tax=Candidatus Izimoplasma sp. ZiA1 TaxID=2024899 RepID=UPI000BAA4095|nr:hypothetical protein CI105_03765 [Candidatus Izimaplasma bacterium ZiA1]